METPTNTTHLPEAILIEIQARLPLKSISRFKSVCKTWKSTIESVFFRRLFISRHKHSSSSWSLIRGEFMGKELMGLQGCETWDIPKSLASYIPNLPNCTFGSLDSSNGLVLMEGTGCGSFVGNPVLQQWVEIPHPPYECGSFGLVTRVDKDGVVLSFKVVRLKTSETSTCLNVFIYSSETGIWNSKRLHCPVHISFESRMSLNGKLYLLSQIDFELVVPGVLLAHDLYSDQSDDHYCRVIPLPDHSNDQNFKRALSTSGGFVTYIKTLSQEVEENLKIWRLNNDECWQLLWKIRIPFIRYFAPMATHPFDSDIVYIWSQHNRYLVSCNLRRKNCKILRDHSDNNEDCCFMNQSTCGEYMDQISSEWVYGAAVALFQFVLPRWMESVPCPPHAKMIDTSSLLSYIAKIHTSKRDRGQEDFWI